MVLGTALGHDWAEATAPDVKTRIGLMESSGERPVSDSAREPGLSKEPADSSDKSQVESAWFAAAVVAPMCPTEFLLAEYFSREFYSQAVRIQTPGQPS